MAASTLPPPLRLIEPLPIGEATELPGLTVRERWSERAWREWDAEQIAADFDPTQPMPLLEMEVA